MTLARSPANEEEISRRHAFRFSISSLPERLVRSFTFFALATLVPTLALAQSPDSTRSLPLQHEPEATTSAISAADLLTRLYIFADDSMEGRLAGAEGNVKATSYIEREVRRLKLVPAGESGGYFQTIPLMRRSLDTTVATLRVDSTSFALWSDYVPLIPRGTPRSVDGAPSVFGGTLGDTAHQLTPEQLSGKLVIMVLPANPATSASAGRQLRAAANGPLARAAAIAVIAGDSLLATQHESSLGTGSFMKGDPPGPTTLFVSARLARALFDIVDSTGALPGEIGQSGKPVHGRIAFVETPAPFPARNVVAVLTGSDPKLKGQYVAIGAHSDHIGVRTPAVDHDSLRAASFARRAAAVGSSLTAPAADGAAQRTPRRDSIANGADDDGSGSVSVLEIAEAMATARTRPRRSILFVWHTGEESGLLGSRWFTDHPTVRRDSIVAQLNIDMIGRGDSADLPGGSGGGPSYLELVGSRRLSTELGDLVETVNHARRQPFAIDYTFDANGHPENIYCRSDHYMYARYGIPVVFFTTGLHPDYHQVTDEAEYIDYQHMAGIARLVRDVAVRVANLDRRPVVDKPKPDPKGVCRQ